MNSYISQFVKFLTNFDVPQSVNPIKEGRIEKEKKLCEQKDVVWAQTDYGGDVIQFKFNVLGEYQVQGFLMIGPQYPFYQPQIRFELDHRLYSKLNLTSYKIYDSYFPKLLWTPKLTIVEMINSCEKYVASNVELKEKSIIDPLTTFLITLRTNTGYFTTALFVILFALMIRIAVGFGSYSGFNDPPRYGDYEAQRHWMELAVNSPPDEWYRQTYLNDLTWWRLDYPPMSGYFAWFVGQFSKLYDPASVTAITSRGYETPQHKNFMRWSVLIPDLLILFPILIILVKHRLQKYNFELQQSAILMVLLSPLLILIDHGHFQYNCIALGLTMWAAYICDQESLILGSILFAVALNFKQMTLYYALAFFGFILGRLALSSQLKSEQSLKLNFSKLPLFLAYVLGIGIVVILTMVIIWIPWLGDIESFKEFISAIFPVHRGLYQLHVSTFWCITNVIIKWEQLFNHSILVLFSAALTLISCLPAVTCLVINPKLKTFILGLFIISQNFFLFGFHVHEKTILLPLIWLILEQKKFGILIRDYTTFACITMYPLMQEDGLALQFWVIFILFYWVYTKYLEKSPIQKQSAVKETSSKFEQDITKLQMVLNYIHSKYLMKLVILTFMVCSVLSLIVKPPEKYPYIWSLIYVCLGFYGFLFVQVQASMAIFKQTFRSTQKKKRD